MFSRFFSGSDTQIAMRVSVQTILLNAVLSLGKLLAGLIAHSGAMISDAVHSASDVLSTILVMIGVRMSSKASDRSHEYGHERMECVVAILLAMMLLLTGAGIGFVGIRNIVSGTHGTLTAPGALALWAAVISIVVKEAMFWYTRAAAKKTNSGALMADAWHHRSDALSSIGSFIGIFGARLGFPILDPIASIIICLFIIKVSVDIFRDAIDKMIDKSCDAATEEKMRQLVLAQDGVYQVDLLQTRLFGNKLYVDLEISADGALPLTQAHRIAENVHDVIESQYPIVKHCMVHVNPLKLQNFDYPQKEA